jgi:preprotein translocase subunit SecG
VLFFKIITTLLVIVEAICCVLLVGIILLQRTKSQGSAGGMAFGAGMGEQLFGAQAGNILTRITAVLTVIFLVTTTLLAILSGRTTHRSGPASVTDRLQTSAPPPAASGMPGPGPGATAPGTPAGAPLDVPTVSDGPAPAATAGGDTPLRIEAPTAPAPVTPAAEPAKPNP